MKRDADETVGCKVILQLVVEYGQSMVFGGMVSASQFYSSNSILFISLIKVKHSIGVIRPKFLLKKKMPKVTFYFLEFFHFLSCNNKNIINNKNLIRN